jgi:hypothetical protein
LPPLAFIVRLPCAFHPFIFRYTTIAGSDQVRNFPAPCSSTASRKKYLEKGASEEFDLDLPADWSRRLHEQARCSDMAGIEKSMGGFEEIVGRLAEENRAGFIPARR